MKMSRRDFVATGGCFAATPALSLDNILFTFKRWFVTPHWRLLGALAARLGFNRLVVLTPR